MSSRISRWVVVVLCAVRLAQEYDWDLGPRLGHRHSHLDGMKFSFQGTWEFKGWVTDYWRGSIQGFTNDEVATLVSDRERMVPQQAQKWIDWDQTGKEQGTWPTKMMVSMWFKNETNLVTMIDLLKIMKEELEKSSLQDSWAKCEGETGSQSSEETVDKDTCFVLQGTQFDARR